MSQRIGDMTIITEEPDFVCFLCGKIDETRPYGPNGEEICYDCAMKDKETTERMMAIKLFGVSEEEYDKERKGQQDTADPDGILNVATEAKKPTEAENGGEGIPLQDGE